MLLITGAIWANESWGRPWGFDSKETGALVAWLTYAAFLHTRISRGWSGRSSAYFAIVGFLLVIFTYLGVSYLLPGLAQLRIRKRNIYKFSSCSLQVKREIKKGFADL
jgi:ABC-type transport system involved in cytochrome c biogenesis permease subunit